MSKHDDNDNTNEGQRLELQGKPKGMRSHSCDAIQCLFPEHAYHKTKPPRTSHDTIRPTAMTIDVRMDNEE